MPLRFELGSAVTEIEPSAWDALAGPSNPFVEHGFLSLLEVSGSVGQGTGWLPRPVLVFDGSTLVGASPTYLRSDSYGEYIFDWSWAQAADRAGLPYYPKLTTAVPFTPATGPRLLVHPDASAPAVRACLIEGLDALEAAPIPGRRGRASGHHVLFCREEELEALAAHGYARRATHQYHWRNDGYADFDAFLAALRSPARKQIRRERRDVAATGLRIERKLGLDLQEQDWVVLERFYRQTSSEKWGRPYLTPAFFREARRLVGPRALGVIAYRGDTPIAGTLSFQKGEHLYGRYWGATEDVPMLHFELCYYQLIEHAIASGIRLVEAGAQGEHKLKRGFVPVEILSAHRLANPSFHDAVKRFLDEERAAVSEAIPEWAEHAPFRADSMPAFPAIAGRDVGRSR